MQRFLKVSNKRHAHSLDSSGYDMEIKIIFSQIIFANTAFKNIFKDHFTRKLNDMQFLVY